jgi:VWFA-related protein
VRSFDLGARAAIVAGAASGIAAAQNGPPVFKSGVDLVRFDLRVTDGSGRPITDLRPDEVHIADGGETLPLLLFQHIDEPAGAYTDAAIRAVSAEVSTNRGAPRGHLYVLVFDQAHIISGNEQIARHAAEAFIRTRVRPSDRVAVFGLPGPGPSVGFTADRSRAIAELAKVRGALERVTTSATGNLTLQEAYAIAAGDDRVTTDVVTRQALDPGADVGGTADTQAARLAGRMASRQTEDPAAVRHAVQENARTVIAQADAASRDVMQRLVDLMNQYRSIEGRKIVVLFSEGFQQRNVTRELEQVEAAAAESYAVFFTFDLNRRTGGDPALAETTSTDEAIGTQERLEPLASLAADTDGALIPDAASHLDAALDRIAEQAQDYYLVGFRPSNAALAARGQYRRLSINVSRPGAHVSARTGYAAPPAAQSLDRRGEIDAALAAPFAQQALRLEYTTYALRAETSGRARVVLSLGADLPLGDAAHDSADVVFVARDAHDGRVAASGSGTMPLPATATAGVATGACTFLVQFEVPPGSYIMRTVVREPGGLIGSADRKFDVRSFSGPDVTVSDLMLGSATGMMPVRAKAYENDGIAGALEAYGRSPEQLRGLAVTASLVPTDSDRPVQTMRADIGQTLDERAGATRRATFSMPLSTVAPGSYLMRVSVTAGSETVADLSREVDVSAGSAPQVQPPAVQPSEILAGDFVRSARAALQRSDAPAAARATAGFQAFARSDYATAATELNNALRLDQSNAAVAFVLGWAYEAQGDHRHAIGAWRTTVAIDPKMVPAHLALADGYLRIAEPALAAQALHAGLQALPESPELRAKLAQIERSR